MFTYRIDPISAIHASVTVWSNGANVGELTMQRGEAEAFVARRDLSAVKATSDALSQAILDAACMVPVDPEDRALLGKIVQACEAHCNALAALEEARPLAATFAEVDRVALKIAALVGGKGEVAELFEAMLMELERVKGGAAREATEQ